ncbi:hypothetical protein BGX26_002717 [Mortierella sp. AD094]|nr:hypothetical protein BGX26_002717 [Mortierella sp. AD094]
MKTTFLLSTLATILMYATASPSSKPIEARLLEVVPDNTTKPFHSTESNSFNALETVNIGFWNLTYDAVWKGHGKVQKGSFESFSVDIYNPKNHKWDKINDTKEPGIKSLHCSKSRIYCYRIDSPPCMVSTNPSHLDEFLFYFYFNGKSHRFTAGKPLSCTINKAGDVKMRIKDLNAFGLVVGL